MDTTCFIFVWDDVPEGGANDLVQVCKSLKAAMESVDFYKERFANVHIMTAEGEIIGIK